MNPHAYKLMREMEERERTNCPRRKKRVAQSHVAAAMLHLNLSMNLLKHLNRPDAIRILRIIRQLKPFNLDPNEPRIR